MLCEQLGEQGEYVVRSDAPGDQNRQAFSGVFVDHGQHPEGPAVMGAGQDEVVGPDVVWPAWPETDAGPVVEP